MPSPLTRGEGGPVRFSGWMRGCCESARRGTPHPVREGGPPSPRFAGRGLGAFVFLVQLFIPAWDQFPGGQVIYLQILSTFMSKG